MTFDEQQHPRAHSGRFAVKGHTAPEITMTEQAHCPNCDTARARGVFHRCPALGLLALTSATRRVLAACRAAGGRPIIVGGSVRDALLSGETAVAPKDIDIEVYGVSSYEPLSEQLSELGRVDLTGVSFGVLKISIGDEDFDVSLPRTDSKTGDGHRGFTTTADATLDEVQASGRRDFTVNAMGWDPANGDLIDPWGGAADLRDGILRHTTTAFSEDPLRVIRAMQFSARFGFDLAPETADLARSISDRFGELATERVWGEWRKVATRGIHISKALETLEATGWLTHFPALAALRDTPQDPGWHPEGDVLVHSGLAADEAAANAIAADLPDSDREIAVLGALLHDIGKPSTTVIGERITSSGHAEAGEQIAKTFLRSIGAPHNVVDRVVPLVREHMCHTSTAGAPTPAAVRRLMRRLSQSSSGATIFDWARVVDADCAGRGAGAKPSPSAVWLEIATRIGPTPQKPILRGDHLMAAGWVPKVEGRAMGAVIKASLAAQDDGAFDDEAGAVAWFQEHGDSIRAGVQAEQALTHP